jgi:hypothetical protein
MAARRGINSNSNQPVDETNDGPRPQPPTSIAGRSKLEVLPSPPPHGGPEGGSASLLPFQFPVQINVQSGVPPLQIEVQTIYGSDDDLNEETLQLAAEVAAIEYCLTLEPKTIDNSMIGNPVSTLAATATYSLSLPPLSPFFDNSTSSKSNTVNVPRPPSSLHLQSLQQPLGGGDDDNVIDSKSSSPATYSSSNITTTATTTTTATRDVTSSSVSGDGRRGTKRTSQIALSKSHKSQRCPMDRITNCGNVLRGTDKVCSHCHRQVLSYPISHLIMKPRQRETKLPSGCIFKCHAPNQMDLFVFVMPLEAKDESKGQSYEPIWSVAPLSSPIPTEQFCWCPGCKGIQIRYRGILNKNQDGCCKWAKGSKVANSGHQTSTPASSPLSLLPISEPTLAASTSSSSSSPSGSPGRAPSQQRPRLHETPQSGNLPPAGLVDNYR